VRQLAEHCALVERAENSMVLAVNKDGSFLLTEQQQEKLVEELRGHINESLKVEFRVVEDAGETIARQAVDESAQQLRAAKESIASDPALKELVDLFDAEIEADSIRPLD
jgi:DNA polymerase-3 subunit gamma/tau